jgi:VWFA-related protein
LDFFTKIWRKEEAMPSAMTALWAISAAALLAQAQQSQEVPIRISAELVQLDVVVTDKKGQIVKSLTKDDFEVYENGKKQQITFFEFVQGGWASRPGTAIREIAGADAGRIFAFVVDDLTVRPEDLAYIRQMLSDFIEVHMRPGDLVAIVRTISGKGLLQQFTNDRDLLRRAIQALLPRRHGLSSSGNPELPTLTGRPDFRNENEQLSDMTLDVLTMSDPFDETKRLMRAMMSLSTANFIVDSMRELPGRKSLVLISGGLPIMNRQETLASSYVSQLINQLTDKAARTGVAIHTMDVRGLQARAALAGFDETPGRSALASSMGDLRRMSNAPRAPAVPLPEESLLNTRGSLDATESQMMLKMLAAATGGIAVTNLNDFNEGIQKIASASDGYYLIGYMPSDGRFNGQFRKIEVKVKSGGLKVYSKQGYFASEEKPYRPASKQEQLLAAMKSPLVRRDISLDMMLLYRAAGSDKGEVALQLLIDPKGLYFEREGDKQRADFDLAGFVFDQAGRLRGSFGETVKVSLTHDEYDRIKGGGFSYSANTVLPTGAYQIRLVVRDNKTNRLGTLSRYVEIPDLREGKLGASSIFLGAVPAGDTQTLNPVPLGPDRRISRNQDLRYMVAIYNAKLRDNKPQVQTQLIVIHEGREIFRGPRQAVQPGNDKSQLVKAGQLDLSKVNPGRYTMVLVITDPLADKKAQTIIRSADFIVVD